MDMNYQDVEYGWYKNSQPHKFVFSAIHELINLDVEENDKNSYFFRKSLAHFNDKVIGTGSFGTVFRCVLKETNEVVAIKKVLQDVNYKNRELQIMKILDHPNCIKLKYFYYETDDSNRNFLHIVMDYMPQNMFSLCCYFKKKNKVIPQFYVKLYSFQVCRALAYMHSMGICHRDIKPQNVLVNINTGVVKVCDFGSAKVLRNDETSVSYTCSRYYRAPELSLGACKYTCAIDVWALGCLIGEMVLGRPVFAGVSSLDHLMEIVKVLGTPTPEEVCEMNSNCKFNFPSAEKKPWSSVFGNDVDEKLFDLFDKIFVYSPSRRITALEVMAHPFFSDLCDNMVLSDGRVMPKLFDFSPQEIRSNGGFYRMLRMTHGYPDDEALVDGRGFELSGGVISHRSPYTPLVPSARHVPLNTHHRKRPPIVHYSLLSKKSQNSSITTDVQPSPPSSSLTTTETETLSHYQSEILSSIPPSFSPSE